MAKRIAMEAQRLRGYPTCETGVAGEDGDESGETTLDA